MRTMQKYHLTVLVPEEWNEERLNHFADDLLPLIEEAIAKAASDVCDAYHAHARFEEV